MKGFEVIKALKEFISENDIIVSSNGNISREVFHHLPHPQIYLRGSMGLPVSVGLGLALANPTKRTLVITGDGNFLMGLGSTVTAAFYKPTNLKILILDNNKYYTTGGQLTVSAALDYSKFLDSFAIGYKCSKIARPNEIQDDFSKFLSDETFAILHLKIDESKEGLTNIPWHPEEIGHRIKAKLTATK
ncbi:MAG: hypothetical protein JXA54_10215 [Candidatus Heimdallarchaeota archaeon]|nr:hypothetical protein [Candidatus Heimdallarchaeota archaeon]